jgi:thioredoxin-related protein
MPRQRWVSFGGFGVRGPGAHAPSRALIWLAILSCALLPPNDAARAAEATPTATEAPALTRDLRADAALAARQHQPLLLFFSLAGCPYCARVRREYLGPMAQDPAQAGRALIRELPIEATLPGFDGATKSAHEIAAAYKVTLFPTIVLVDAHGTEIAEPLVGFSSPDFYGGLLDGRIDAANEKIRQH